MTAISAESSTRRMLDNAERIAVVALYLFLLYRFAATMAEQPANAIYLVTEGVVMLMILFRRSTEQISIRPRDWLVGFGGTFLSMAMIPGTPVGWASDAAVVILLAGFAISLGAKLQLRRSFGIVAANRGLKMRGLYGLVRHPMYAGYFLVLTGMILLNFNFWNLAVVSGWIVLQIMRIEAEERVLTLDPAYRAHADKVRFRLLPGVY